MEIDTTVPDTYTSSAFRVPPPEDPYVADLLQVADSKIAQLESEVKRVQDEKEVMDRKLKTFRQQVGGFSKQNWLEVTDRQTTLTFAVDLALWNFVAEKYVTAHLWKKPIKVAHADKQMHANVHH